MKPKLLLGTRGSKLALAQAYKAQETIQNRHTGLDVEIVPIKTSGDRGDRDRLGACVREIQDALLSGAVDVGLHCLKDLPVDSPEGLCMAAYLPREDPSDAFIGTVSNFDELPKGAVVGTGSIRRSSQIANRRPDLSFKPLVGNIDTRLGKLLKGEYDAIILAIAGLKRLHLLEQWSTLEYASLTVNAMSSDKMLPAPGQAVLVLETREDNTRARELVSFLEHPETRACATAERAFLKVFGGGCSMPIAAMACMERGELQLEGLVAAPDGSCVIRGFELGPLDSPESVAKTLATRLGEQGAWDLISQGAVAP